MNDVLNDLQLECLFRASPEFSESNKLSTYSSVAHALSAYMKRKDYKSSRECFITVTDNICKYLEVY